MARVMVLLAALVVELAAPHAAAWSTLPVGRRSGVVPDSGAAHRPGTAVFGVVHAHRRGAAVTVAAAATPAAAASEPEDEEEDGEGEAEEDIDQRRLNRVRDCAVANKAELMRILQSTRIFTRTGKARISELVDQIAFANPVATPSESALLGGTWVGQGTSRRTQVIRLPSPEAAAGGADANATTTDSFLGNVLGFTHEWDLSVVDGHQYSLRQRERRVRLGHLSFGLPTRLRGTSTRVLYLDCDLQISLREGRKRPDVFVKGAVDAENVNQRRWQSPLRIRQRTAGAFRNVVEQLGLQNKSSTDNKEMAGKRWLIGTADLRETETSPFLTDENLLEKMKAEAEQIDSGLSIDDLLSGRIRKGRGG